MEGAGGILGEGVGVRGAVRNVEEHLQHLAQGGELITHLWAILYHAGICKWQFTPHPQIKMGWDYMFRIRSFIDLEDDRRTARTWS